MKIKNILLLILALLTIGCISILIHEFIHFLQLHYFYGIPFENIRIYFFWDYNDSNLSLFEKLFSYPGAWVTYINASPTSPINRTFMEVPAYIIQYSFIIIVYFRFIYKKEMFTWR